MDPEAAYWRAVANSRAPTWGVFLNRFIAWVLGLLMGAALWLFR